MKSFPLGPSTSPSFAAAVGLILLAAGRAPAPPDPCTFITVAELAQIVGPLKPTIRRGDAKAGDVSCEWSPVKGPSWVSIRLGEGDLGYWKKRNGGKSPVAVPEFGAGAFLNPDSNGSTDLYLKKGDLTLIVSMPTGPQSIGWVKAIANKATTR